MAKYLYNGKEFPALLEHDKETHPYEAIGYCDVHGYVFSYSSTPWSANEEGKIYPSRLLTYRLSDDGTTWESTNGVVSYITPVWSNHDIYNEDGTLYLAASDPVPVLTRSPAAMALGWLAGMAVRRMRGAVRQVPVAFLYSSAQLSDIDNVWTDKKTYPYGAIGILDNELYLTTRYQPFSAYDDGTYYIPASGALSYKWTGEEWAITMLTMKSLIAVWASYDMQTDEGNLVMSTSEPMPVYSSEETVIIEPTILDFTDGASSASGLSFQESATYIVRWDDVKYRCQSYKFEMDGTTGILIGNGKNYGFANTGEPFLLIDTGAVVIWCDLPMSDPEGNPTGESSHIIGLSVPVYE